MLAKRIIPCLDVKDGRVVKGVNFKELRDAGDPVEIAMAYEEAGADELVFLDITASYEDRKTIIDVVEKTAEVVSMPLTVGGGIKTLDDIRALLNAGADKVSINTAAVKNPDLITEASQKFGSQCIVLAIDTKYIPGIPYGIGRLDTDTLDLEKYAKSLTQFSLPGKYEVFTHGGTEGTGWNAINWAKRGAELGAGEILLTSMDKDGTKDGYDNNLLSQVAELVSVPLIASGGAGTLEHFYEAINFGHADAVLAASVFHHNEFTIKEVKDYLKEKGLEVRV